jgi:hypothetical protein
LAGVIDMEDRAAEVTVSVPLPEAIPEVAVTIVAPAARAAARPLLSTVATRVLDELQVTCLVMLKLVPSEKMPMAVNCWLTPTGMLELAGVTDMEDSAAEVTVRVVLPEILPEVAVMVAVPTKEAAARPLLLTVATNVFDELQVTCMVMSKLVPSE